MMTSRISFFIALAIWLTAINVQANDWQYAGHVKYRASYSEFDVKQRHSTIPIENTDQTGNVRLNLDWNHDNWSATWHDETGLFYGDTIKRSNNSFSINVGPPLLPNDDSRLFDLTYIVNEGEQHTTVHHIDRLTVGYQDAYNVVKFGRQVISWGNGMFYSPMDFLNPFAPNAIEKEYKSGDDMLYAQRLFDSGNDLQLATVIRRDGLGDLSQEVNTTAAKYHAFVENIEVDALVSQHYDDWIVGGGVLSSPFKGILRGDVVITKTDVDTYVSIVTNFSYSWTVLDKNMSGIVEYFYNGMGADQEDYDTPNSDLMARINRGELFTLGKHYLASSVSIEITPLWMLTPNIFYNLGDNSTLLQITSQHDLARNWLLLASLAYPVGDEGSEFGGLSLASGTTLITPGGSASIQLAWYF